MDNIDDELKVKIKSLIANEFENIIGKNREWNTNEPYDNPDITQGYNEALDDMRQKLEEWKK